MNAQKQRDWNDFAWLLQRSRGSWEGPLRVVTKWGEVIQRRSREHEGFQKFGHTFVEANEDSRA